MIDKLLKSNPKAYTLPLLREGVTPYIKKLSSMESIEKTTGLHLSELPPVDSKEDLLS